MSGNEPGSILVNHAWMRCLLERAQLDSIAEVDKVRARIAFHAAWAEGAALNTEEVIAYAQRGRGQRKRPDTGWESLTPTEGDVVRLVCEGLSNKDVAARLLISRALCSPT